jgi:hypothetical protein
VETHAGQLASCDRDEEDRRIAIGSSLEPFPTLAYPGFTILDQRGDSIGPIASTCRAGGVYNNPLGPRCDRDWHCASCSCIIMSKLSLDDCKPSEAFVEDAEAQDVGLGTYSQNINAR